MNFELSEDQTLLRDSVRRWVENEYTFETRQHRIKREGGFSRAHWQAFAEMGWLGVSLPEQYGGLGGAMVDAALVLEELGRGLVAESYLNNAVLPAQLLLLAAPEAQRDALLEQLVSGECLWAVAHAEVAARGSRDAVQTTAVAEGDGYRLNGGKTLVHAAAQADRLLLTARLDSGALALFQLPRETAGLRIREYPLVDGATAADLELTQLHLPASALISPDVADALDAALAAAMVCVCAEMIGGMEHALWTTRDYLRTRKQFGVAIGSFQVLQHRMADMYIALEQARVMLFRGLAFLDGEATARRDAAAAAKVQVGKCAQFVCAQAIQLHGGIGVTDEYPVGHYFKHLMVLEAQYGNTSFHIGQLAQSLRRAA